MHNLPSGIKVARGVCVCGGGGGEENLGGDNSYPRLSPSKKACSQKANISFLFFHILPFAKTVSQLADIRFFGLKI